MEGEWAEERGRFRRCAALWCGVRGRGDEEGVRSWFSGSDGARLRLGRGEERRGRCWKDWVGLSE